VHGAFVQKQSYAESAASDKLPQNGFWQRDVLDATPCHIDSKVRTVITEGHVTHPRPRTESEPNHLREEVFEDR